MNLRFWLAIHLMGALIDLDLCEDSRRLPWLTVRANVLRALWRIARRFSR